MEPTDIQAESLSRTGLRDNVSERTSSPADAAPIGDRACPTCASSPYVYALGRIEIRFPSLSIEKELAQAVGRADTAGLTDPEALHKVLSEHQNRYLVRQLSWVLSIEGLETYVLQPRDPADFDLLMQGLSPAARRTDVSVVIGARGPIAAPERCNGLVAPVVTFDQIYTFDVDSLIQAIPRPEKFPEKEFSAAAEEIFMRIMQMADNTGATDEHRALNYLAVRYPAVYAKAAESHGIGRSLTAVDVRPSRLSSFRKILDVIFTYTDRKTDVNDRHFVRVDVSEEFPFMVTKMSPYYER